MLSSKRSLWDSLCRQWVLSCPFCFVDLLPSGLKRLLGRRGTDANVGRIEIQFNGRLPDLIPLNPRVAEVAAHSLHSHSEPSLIL